MLNYKKIKLFFLFVFLFGAAAMANDVEINRPTLIVVDSSFQFSDLNETTIDSLIQHETKKQKIKKKVLAGVFSFPFPFGFMGAHRVILGTKPWIPVVYVVTLGGCFGLLPLIDFCVLTFSKDIEQYENNPHIFMWIK